MKPGLFKSRMHVHVISGDGEAKFWLEPDIKLSQNHKYSNKQLSEIKSLIEDTTMSLSQLGKGTSEIEVTNISGHGIWLLVRGVEYFLSYDNFPWFRDKTVGQIFNVEEASPGHFYWPELDIDLSEKIIQDPLAFPLQAKNT